MEESDHCLESAPKRSRSEQNIEEFNNWPSNGDGSGDPSSKENEQSSSISCSISSGADCIDTETNSAGVNINKNSTDSGLDMIFGSEMPENLLNNPMANESQKNDHIQSEACAMMPENISVPENNLNGGALEVEEGDKATGSTFAKKRQLRNRNRNYRCAKKRSSSLSLSLSPSSSTSSVLKFDIDWLFRSTEEQPKKETEENLNVEDETLQLDDNELPPWDTSTDSAREANDSINFGSSVEEDESSSLNSSSSSSSSSNDSDSDNPFSVFVTRSDSEGDTNEFSASLLSPSYLEREDKKEEIKSLLTKPKPSYNWNSTYELMRRESGLRGDGRGSLRGGMGESFAVRYYASRHVVERMKLSHALHEHNGCVNCLNFNRAGNLLVTGSDDARLIIWDWAHSKTKYVWKSGHTANIFQSKFIPSSGCIDVVSAGRDAQVRRSIVPSSGGTIQTSCLYSHRGPVHKFVLCPQNPSEIITVGEDGYIQGKDLRSDEPYNKMLLVSSDLKPKYSKKVGLYGISHHPYAPEICVSGCDNFVRVYDKRNMRNNPLHMMCPEHLLDYARITSVTCCVYNNTGTEILATYGDENIYLFNNLCYEKGTFLHCYKGHVNQQTIKGVNFFGPNCEYVISGSDCGNIYYWDKNTEAILNFMPGDVGGVINCLEPHPSVPILATSGLDYNIKIWTPNAETYPPDLADLENCVLRNMTRTTFEDIDAIGLDHGQFHFFIRHYSCRRRGLAHATRRGGSNERRNRGNDEASTSSTDDTSLDNQNGDSDDVRVHGTTCGTQ
uniref:WD_REPEATS_REGION domain-containing protein n=1 Tax=Glossina austeni TaxID=7395 RepID=A0A1A9VMK8_GLOAU